MSTGRRNAGRRNNSRRSARIRNVRRNSASTRESRRRQRRRLDLDPDPSVHRQENLNPLRFSISRLGVLRLFARRRTKETLTTCSTLPPKSCLFLMLIIIAHSRDLLRQRYIHDSQQRWSDRDATTRNEGKEQRASGTTEKSMSKHEERYGSGRREKIYGFRLRAGL